MSDAETTDPALHARANDELGRAVIALIREEPFFGHLLSSINRDITSKTPNAGVSFRNGRPLLSVNPGFFVNETPIEGQQSAIIKHEVLHLLLDHAGRLRPDMDSDIFNLAADVVINQLVGEKWPLPPGAIHLDSFDFELPPDMTVEWYYRELLERADQIPDDMQSGHSDHEQWDTVAGEDDAIGEHEMNKAIRDARDRSGESFGLVPAEIQELVEASIERLQPSVDWRRVLRLFTTSSRRTRISNTLRRPSKRYGTYPGTKVKRFQRLAVIIDTSGSIKEDSLLEFFTEVRAIWRQGTEVTIIEADNAVRDVWEYRGQVPDRTRGRGGTQFDPALQWVADANPRFDAALYFTDGQAPPPKVLPGCDVLWVLTANGNVTKLNGQRTVKLSR